MSDCQMQTNKAIMVHGQLPSHIVESAPDEESSSRDNNLALKKDDAPRTQ